MSRGLLDRRRFLRLSCGLVLLPFTLPGRPARAAARSRKVPYTVDVRFVHGALQFHLVGTLNEDVDPAAGRYHVTVVGEGAGISHRIQSTGALIQGRWAPHEANSRFSVLGRESRTEIVYDWTRRRVDYHFRGETFFLRRLRMADDVLAIPASMHVDDLISAALNYADARWPAQADGSLRTHVVRRKKPDDEGPDDVLQSYGADLSPLVLQVEAGEGSGKRSALIDFTRFSAWARRDQPVEVTFGNEGHLEAVRVPMILGSSVAVAFGTEEQLRRGTS
jgi:hypothetical protein